MDRRHVLAIACIPLLLLASCGQRQGQPQAAAPPANAAPAPAQHDADTDPALHIDNRQEVSFAPATKVITWAFRGHKVKELVLRLLVCADGKANNHHEVTCRWDAPSEPLSGQLLFLVQDGEPFGAKGKRLPSLGLAFRSGAPSARTEKRVSALIEGELPHRMSRAGNATSVPGKEVLYAEVSGPLPEKGGSQSLSLGGAEDSVVEASKEGRVALAVILEWKP